MASNDVWVFAEHQNGEPRKMAQALTSKARELADQLGGQAVVICLGPGGTAAANALGAFGAQRALVNEDAQYTQFSVTPYSQTLTALIRDRQPRLVLFGNTPDAKDVAGRVGARLGLGILANVVELSLEGGEVRAINPAFGGSLQVTSTFASSDTGLISVRANAFPPQQIGGSVEVEQVDSAFDPAKLQAKVGETIAESASPVSLEEAQVIVSGGRGLGGPEAFSLIFDLANALGGQVGASRAAVDAGWIPYAHQVGQTGKTVKPAVYIACGISGAIQHKAGMGTSQSIIAINKNPDAPIFGFCDLGVVGDLFEIVPRLTEEVRKRKGQ